MNNNPLLQTREKPDLVVRRNKSIYKRESVLSTDVLPMLRAREYERTLRLIGEAHPDKWYLHYDFVTSDGADAVRRVPTVLAQLNRSRVLRRAQVSGARMCTLTHYTRPAFGMFYYVTDMVVSCSFDAVVIASLLNSFAPFDQSFTVTFDIPWLQGRDRRRRRMQLFDDMVEKFYRKSKLARNAVTFGRVEEEDLGMALLDVKITTTKPIFDVAAMFCDVFRDNIRDIKFGDKKQFFTMSRYCTVDLDKYTYRPIDNMLNTYIYRRFSSFGCYANGQNIVKLKNSKL